MPPIKVRPPEVGLCLVVVVAWVCFTVADEYPKEVHQLFLDRLERTQGGMVGSWGSWSSWSPCSRSCGTGVSIQSRECLLTPSRKRVRRSTMSSRCVGRYKRFQLCNSSDCPGPNRDFRQEQCSSFNRTPFNHRVYTWEPYYDTDVSCALNCRAVGLSFYATLNQTVVDGTQCGPERDHRICVSGKCMTIGCDGIIGSGRLMDSCGICGGNNSTCRVFAGIYGRPKMPYGYNVIATLPIGASNITIQQMRPSPNYLALKEKGGAFFLNGNWAVNTSGSYKAAGTSFNYQSSQSYIGDVLTSPGPLGNSVDVMLFYQTTNPGIRYEYKLPVSSSHHGSPRNPPRAESPSGFRDNDNPLNPLVPGGPASRAPPSPPSGPINDERSRNGHPNSIYPTRGRNWEKEKKIKKEKEIKNRKKKRKKYQWKMIGFTTCSTSCGGGTQISMYICVKRKKGTEVPNKYCGDAIKPESKTVKCNVKPCPPVWYPSPWSKCNATCGVGIQKRKLSCKQRISEDLTVSMTDSSSCDQEKQFPTVQVCFKKCQSEPHWNVGEWGDCSTQCGSGFRTRQVTCHTSQGPVLENLCSKDNRPMHQELCDMGSCASDTWFFSAWEGICSESCGSGVQHRLVHCSGGGNSADPGNSCSKGGKPTDVRPCQSDRACGGTWFTGPWSECNVWCGPGWQIRSVMCMVWIRGQYRVTTDQSQCKSSPRPATSQTCNRTCQAQWYTSEWSQCSSTCSGGVQRREVKCLDDHQKPSLQCPGSTKPDTRQTCNNVPCHQETKKISTLKEKDTHDISNHLKDSPTNVPSKLSSTGNTSNYQFLEASKVEYQSRKKGLHDFSGKSKTSGSNFGYSQNNELKSNTLSNSIPSSNKKSTYSSLHDELHDKKRHKSSKEKKMMHNGSCVDRMKNCNLVFKARLCRLKYYYKLCCQTCSKM